MKRNIRNLFPLILLVLGIVACSVTPEQVETVLNAAAEHAPEIAEVVNDVAAEVDLAGTPAALAPTAEPTEEPAPEPTATRQPTRAPRATAQPNPTVEPTDEPADDESHYQYPAGFTPDDELMDIRDEVEMRDVPPSTAADLEQNRCFPQSYAQGDDFNRGCAEEEAEGFPWEEPRAGFNYDFNAACVDVSRHCNIPVDTWKWVVITGEEVYLPGIGSLRDPNGGAVLVVIMNAWEIPGELENAYVLHGWWGTGEVWDMSDLTTDWDEDSEEYVNNVYGDYSLETLATLRNHFLYRLSYERQFRGQCSEGDNCDTVTWATVFRWYDGGYRLTAQGQWQRP